MTSMADGNDCDCGVVGWQAYRPDVRVQHRTALSHHAFQTARPLLPAKLYFGVPTEEERRLESLLHYRLSHTHTHTHRTTDLVMTVANWRRLKWCSYLERRTIFEFYPAPFNVAKDRH